MRRHGWTTSGSGARVLTGLHYYVILVAAALAQSDYTLLDQPRLQQQQQQHATRVLLDALTVTQTQGRHVVHVHQARTRMIQAWRRVRHAQPGRSPVYQSLLTVQAAFLAATTHRQAWISV